MSPTRLPGTPIQAYEIGRPEGTRARADRPRPALPGDLSAVALVPQHVSRKGPSDKDSGRILSAANSLQGDGRRPWGEKARQSELRKLLCLVAGTGDYQHGSSVEQGLRSGVGEVVTRRLDADHGHPVASADAQVAQSTSRQVIGDDRFHHRELLVERKPVDDAPTNLVCHPLAHLILRKHDVMGTDPVEDSTVSLCDGLGPDIGNAQVDERRRCEDARFDVGADSHHRVTELRDAELTEHLLFGGIGVYDVSQDVGVVLHLRFVVLYTENLEAQEGQFLGDRATESTEADNDDLIPLVGRVNLSPRRA